MVLFQNAWSAETFLSVFLNNRPVQGLQVSLDDEQVGETGSDGSLGFEMEAGEHTLQLSKDDKVVLKYDYLTMQRENAEIRVAFSDLAQAPEVNLEKYFPGSEKAGALGVIQGQVSSVAGTPVAGASVMLSGTEYQTTTSESGSYLLKVPRGTYTLEINHPDYKTSTQENIRVVANVGLAVNANLSPRQQSGNKIDVQIGAPNLAPVEEVLILGRFEPTDTTVDIERLSTAIVDAIDAEQLERFGDSSVAGALKRVAGVDVNDGKYAIVRGLDGRYISSTLNGNMMPTTDPLRRDVQLDLFPANILGSIEIQKSYTANLPGDTTGGSIGMITQGLPDERVTRVYLSGGYNFDVTGNDIVTYEGSGGDWLTYDDGLRELPAEVNNAFRGNLGSALGSVNTCNVSGCDLTFEENARLAQQFPVIYNVETESASPDFGLGFAYGNRNDIRWGSLGYYGSVSLKNSTDARIDAVINDENVDATYERSTKSSELSAYLVFGLEDNHDGEWLSKTIFLRQADDTTRLETGFNVDDDNEYQKAMLHWVERQFLAQQFSGEHTLFGKHTLNWRLGASQTTMDEPDRRTWSYVGGIFIPSSTERRFGELTEDGTDAGVDYSLPIDFSSSVSTDVQVGYLYNKRERDWNLARFSFRNGRGGSPADISADPETQLSLVNLQNQVYQLRKSTANTDSFTAQIETTAAYINTETHINDSVTLVAGVRREDNLQELEYPFSGREDSTNTLDESETLPAVALSYNLNDIWQFRASFSQTVSRPGVIERSESTMYDPKTDEQIFGNPNLVSADIDNMDLRVEYYFNDGGSISLAWFSKSITNPIEKTVPDASGSAAVNSYTFRNALSADVSGVELDFNKTILDFANWSTFVAGNISSIESEVELDDESIRLEGEDSIGRDLQGQSPLLANLQIGFDHFPTRQKVTLLINYFDDKIYKVGRGTNFDNVLEQGRTTMDLTYEKEFENYSKLNIKLGNLLNDEIQYSQNDRIIESYSEGTDLTIKYTYNF